MRERSNKRRSGSSSEFKEHLQDEGRPNGTVVVVAIADHPALKSYR